jgi:hypothetical protein
MALMPEGALRGGTICDWESLRDSYSSRDTCIRGFAVAYAGMAHDLQQDEQMSFEELYNQLPTDADAIEDVRNRLRNWEQLAIADETAVEASAGWQLAQELVTEEIGGHTAIGRSLRHSAQYGRAGDPNVATC